MHKYKLEREVKEKESI